jgi:cytochrome c-type biogenesis protein CcmF
MTIIVGSALFLYAMRSDSAIESQESEPMQPLSREGLIVINNMFLLTSCATVLLGTLYPMLMEWWQDDRISVGAPYFNATFLPLMALPLVFAGLAPFMPWIRGDVKLAFKKARPALAATGAAGIIILGVTHAQTLTGTLGLMLSVWLLVASVQWIRKQGIGYASLPVFLSHLGAAVLIAGVTGASVWKEEAERGISVGDSIDIAGYHLMYEKQSFEDTANYHAKIGRFRVTNGSGKHITSLTPQYRMYDIRKTSTSVASIHSTLLYDLYAVIGESSADGRKTAVRIYYNPLVNLIWLGCVLMALGGITSLVKKRP